MLGVLVFLLGGVSSTQEPKPDAVPTTEIRDCADCPPMVLVPSPKGGRATLVIARHELTWREYIPSVIEASCPLPPFEGRRKRTYPDNLRHIADDFAIGGVSPNEIGCYLNWLKAKTGRTYRLPTPEEWTHAARAGTTTLYPWGDELGFNNAAVAGYDDKPRLDSSNPRPTLSNLFVRKVESFAPNPWGLYDVVGNLPEFVADTRPPPAICLKVADAGYCRLQETRGGGTGIITIGTGGVRKLQPDPIGIPVYSLAGGHQPVGYRFVRD